MASAWTVVGPLLDVGADSAVVCAVAIRSEKRGRVKRRRFNLPAPAEATAELISYFRSLSAIMMCNTSSLEEHEDVCHSWPGPVLPRA